MDLRTIAGWLDRITYKPDTQITANYAVSRDVVELIITRLLPDSTRRITTLAEYADLQAFVKVGARVPCNLGRFDCLPPEEGFRYFQQWLREELIRLERHECDEWFRVDGRLPFDPHRAA
jgi:hypothetical protein